MQSTLLTILYCQKHIHANSRYFLLARRHRNFVKFHRQFLSKELFLRNYAVFVRLTIVLSNVPGHSFIRKWMLLSNPQDKGGDENEPVGVVIFL